MYWAVKCGAPIAPNEIQNTINPKYPIEND